MSASDAQNEQAPAPKARQPKGPKPKFTYMLHSPEDLTALGKYVSTDYRYAALKAVSRWHKKGLRRFLLRRTNSKDVVEFAGSLVPLSKPKEIKRAGSEEPIVYHFKPDVKYVTAWKFGGNKLEPQTP